MSQVAVENTTNIGRRIKVTIPKDEVHKKFEEHLKEAAKKAKIDGYRPGKVTVDVVKERYGKSIFGEVVNELIRTSLFETLTKENLNPAGTPMIEEMKADEGEPLEYTAVFDIYPEIKLVDFKQIKVTKPVINISEKDIAHMQENVRKQFKNWEKVDRAAKMDDRLTIDFEGKIDGEVFNGGTAKNVHLVLGSKMFIPGFEDELVGVKAGDSRDVKVTFPADYHAKDLAGKPSVFAVTVHLVEESKLPEIDDAFIKRMGVADGSIEGLHKQLQSHMERELNYALKHNLKAQVFEQLVKIHEVDIPKSLVDREAEHLHQEMHQHEKGHNDQHHHHEHPELESEAKKRVALSLLLGEIIKKENIKADTNKVIKLIEEYVQTYQDPKSAMEYFMKNKERLATFEMMALEDQVLDYILAAASVTDKPETYAEYMKIKSE